MTHPSTPASPEALIQGLRGALAPLAEIDPNGAEFKRAVDVPLFARDPSGTGPIPPTELRYIPSDCRLCRGGRTATLRSTDIQRARTCLQNPDTSILELLQALQPLAALPDDGVAGTVFVFNGRRRVELTGASIRLARTLVQAADLAK